MEVYGLMIPLWAFFIIAVIAVFVVWKLIKFAIKLLIITVVFFAILIGFDILGVFNWINNNIISIFL